MEAIAFKKYVRTSRRKIARISKECVGKNIKEVKAQLSFLSNNLAKDLFQTLKSAESNFLVKNPNSNPDDLIVKQIIVDKGPSFKRIIYRAKGRANRIEKKTSHIKVIVQNKNIKVNEKVGREKDNSKKNKSEITVKGQMDIRKKENNNKPSLKREKQLS